MTRLSPAQRHVQHIAAQLQGEQQDLAHLSEYDKMLYLLARHKKDLGNIQSKEAKAEYKRNILPDYLDWINGVMQAGTGRQDDVLMMWLIWATDCGEYELALKIGEYALFHDLALPEGFNRTTATAIAEEFADAASKAATLNQEFDLDFLLKANEITQHSDMPDESRARLLKELGLQQKESNPEQALINLTRALSLNQNVGVKGEIKALRKKLNLTEETE